MGRRESGMWRRAKVAAPICFSAGTYLFGYFSNIAITVKYYQHFSEPSYSMLFYNMLTLLLTSHILNGLFFLLKFPRPSSSAALRAAYFLPLIHFYRLLHLAWSSRSIDSWKDVASEEMNILFSVLGTSMESGPLLTVQFISLNLLYTEDVRVTALISIAASIASVTYNVGTAVMWTSKNVTTLGYKICVVLIAGAFSSCALVLRCFSFLWVSEFFEYAWIPPTIFCIAIMAIDWVLFLLLLTPQTNEEKSPFHYRKFFRSFGFCHMCLTVGPLYPMVDEGKEKNILGQPLFRFKVLCMAVANVLPDTILVSLVIFAHGFKSPLYLIGIGVSGALYSFFIVCYCWIDKRCGFQNLQNNDDQELHMVDEENSCDSFPEHIYSESNLSSIWKTKYIRKVDRSLSLP